MFPIMHPYQEHLYFSALQEGNFILPSQLRLLPLPPVVLSDSLFQAYIAG